MTTPKKSAARTTTSPRTTKAASAGASKKNVPAPTAEADLLDPADEEEDADDIENLDVGDLTLDITNENFFADSVSYTGGDDTFVLDGKAGALALAHPPLERTRDSLHLYLREINKFPLLQPEEELLLARKAREDGDPDAAFRLVSSHLRLVVRVAMDFQRRWMQNVLDLIQEGNVGLVKAVSKFDPEKGIKFSYYATFWIKAYILKFIMDNWRLVKIGTTQTQRKLFYNLNKERQHLIAQGFDPDTAMLAERLNVSTEQISEMEQRLDASDMSLNAPMNDENAQGATRMDYLPALGPGIEETLGDNQISHIVRERLQSLIPLLSDKEAFILQHRLLTDEPITLREIGEEFNITRERVRQIEARLLQKVRDHLFNNIKDFSRAWIE